MLLALRMGRALLLVLLLVPRVLLLRNHRQGLRIRSRTPSRLLLERRHRRMVCRW